jgi:hypothetical protein
MGRELSRTPPLEVRKVLQKEVSFGCPVDGCRSPYLEWHHFDPEWKVRHHHDPNGMIALCGEHHSKAGGGAFTLDQLRELKRHPGQGSVEGRFDWMRQRLLGVVGGCLYLETPILVEYRGQPAISFDRNEDGLVLVNVRMPTSGDPAERALMEQNFWIARGDPEDLQCPPHGRLLQVQYQGGDLLRVEFFEVPTWEALISRYPHVGQHEASLRTELPLTAVDVRMRVPALAIDFGPLTSTVLGNQFVGAFFSGGRTGFAIG